MEINKRRRNMKKLLLVLSFILISTLLEAQNSWTKIDTVRVQVEYTTKNILVINPEPSERLGSEFWDPLLKDMVYTDIEEFRKLLEPFEFKSVSCYLDSESGSLVFCFEKIIVETEIWKKKQ